MSSADSNEPELRSMEDAHSSGIRGPDQHTLREAVDNFSIESVLYQRGRNEHLRGPEGVDGIQGPIILRPFGVPKTYSSQMSRLSLSATLFLLNLARLFLSDPDYIFRQVAGLTIADLVFVC